MPSAPLLIFWSKILAHDQKIFNKVQEAIPVYSKDDTNVLVRNIVANDQVLIKLVLYFLTTSTKLTSWKI